jgi:hypothetical protein
MTSDQIRRFQLRKNGEIVHRIAASVGLGQNLRPEATDRLLDIQSAWRSVGGLNAWATQGGEVLLPVNLLSDRLAQFLQPDSEYLLVIWLHDSPDAVGDKSGSIVGSAKDVALFAERLVAKRFEDVLLVDTRSPEFFLLDYDQERSEDLIALVPYSFAQRPAGLRQDPLQ